MLTVLNALLMSSATVIVHPVFFFVVEARCDGVVYGV